MTQPDGPRYKAAVFRSTHNSYSGGARGTIRAQLDAGVRFIEFDVYAPACRGEDFRVGHTKPGHEVDHGGDNPDGDALRDWLGVVAGWVRGRGGNSGIVTLGLDMKSKLVEAAVYEDGSLAMLNSALREVFGGALVTPHEFAELGGGEVHGPLLAALRGRVLVVLSGHAESRVGYRWNVGLNPAVAVNTGGWVVEVHESPSGPVFMHDLWYCTGRRTADGRVEWLHRGKYDRGTTPAVAMNDSGLVVEVHKSGLYSTLYCRVGQLNKSTGNVDWNGPAVKYDKGVEPTIAFHSLSASDCREIHRSETRRNDKWSRRGTASGSGVLWEENGKTSDSPFEKSTAQFPSGGALSVSSSTAASGSDAPVVGTLRYTSGHTAGRIAYAQLAFVEWQSGNSAALAADGAFFRANKAQYMTWVVQQRKAGNVVRQWAFNTALHGTQPAANFPATDEPFATWYKDFCAGVGAVED
jgi:hypothetical protein